MKLTSENVQKTLLNCLFKDEDISDGTLMPEARQRLKEVRGVRGRFRFDTAELDKNKTHIEEMLSELPDSFKSSSGGGMSFLNACLTKNGDQWGDHSSIDELICLGLAIDKVSFPMPREMWDILPGGMPYVTVNI